jgi:16S rRNA (adenine1518-N6/adenine1519-N6)-dimethyltransferase
VKLTEIKSILAERGIRLTRSLGQSFLHDGNQLRRIVDAAELRATDKVLEIGPGLGPLTELLLERAGEVFAIEKDARLAAALRERFGSSSPRLQACFHLVVEDALAYLDRQSWDWTDWKLVSNLPYSVASPILVELAQSEQPPERLVATVQLEVAQRITAGPGDADYGVLTLLLQLNFEPQSSFKIPASCFFPKPDVDSACVRLLRRADRPLTASAQQVFARIVKRSFSQRRKMMFKLLKEDWPERALAAAFEEAAIPAHTRAETVARQQFIRLAQLLTAN